MKKITKKEESLYMKAVLRAHNIEIQKDGTFMCNDGDCMDNIWKALDHTIYLDLISKRLLDPDRDCNDYYEIINEKPSYQSIKEDMKKVKK